MRECFGLRIGVITALLASGVGGPLGAAELPQREAQGSLGRANPVGADWRVCSLTHSNGFPGKRKALPILLTGTLERPKDETGGSGVQMDPGTAEGSFPSTEAITGRRVFLEPLVPVGGQPMEDENRALWHALDTYLAKGDPQAEAPLRAFLTAYPTTRWRASLLSNLGWVYGEGGRLGRAQDAWREAWDLAKTGDSPQERAVADRSAAQLANLLGRLGRKRALRTLLQETQGRVRTGSAGSLLGLAAQQMDAMEQDPARTFRCGPVALGSLAESLGVEHASDKVERFQAGPRGTNLAQIQAWGRDLGIELQGHKLEPGAPIPVPSLVAWRTGHFATVVKSEGGRFLVRNYLAGEDKWLTAKVVKEEMGHFALVPGPFPRGGGRVALGDLRQVWGTGTTTGPDPCGPNVDQDKCGTKLPPCTNGMATYTFYAAQDSLLLEDVPLWYAPPVGPAVNFHVFYNQWDPQQPQTFTYWNLGSKWTMDWLSYVSDDPANPGVGTSVYMRGGGLANYSGYSSSTGAFVTQFYHHDLLVRTSATSYERRLADGSKEIFAAPDGAVAPRKVFLTQIIDPSGNTLSFTYDAQRRMTQATDALGQATTLSYGLAADPLKVTKVIDPFGRTATFDYSNSLQLIRITDMGKLTSEFRYGPTTAAPAVGADFLNALITPYGVTSFAAGTSGTTDRWLQATDPLGQTERAEYRNYTGSMPASDAAVPSGCWNNYFCYRNTFYWDKRAMAAGGDWTLARIYHYMHGPSGYTSTLKESIKPPLENRIFYGYGTSDGSYYVEGTNTSNPTNTSRMLDDGTQQWNRARYNAWGKPLAVTDPSGRVTSYTYSTDGIDLLAVRNITGSANDLLASYTYNAQHKPLTVTDAAGQTTILTYNAGGQILTLTNPKNETTLFTYIPAKGGYLTSLTGAMAGATTSFAYDAFGRVRTVTSPDGTAITTDYDNLDRPVMVTYGDGTTEAMIYSRLDLVGRKDRLGRWTSMSYTPLRLLSEVQDPAGRKTTFDWCNCGSLEQLTDPLGHITNWWRDLEGHVIGKQLNNNAITSYGYDSSGRLIERIDARGQLTAYRYYPDNNLMQVSYPNAQIPTPSVGYTYDSRYNRLTAMVDGFGATTYAYYPIGTTPPLGAGRLSSVTGPLANSTISYSYDPLGRVQDRSINGSHGTRTFDALGRIAQVSIPIGAFQYTFLGPTGHLDNILYPSNQKTIFSYFDTTQDFRLQGILNQKSDSSVISAFSYAYNPDGTLSSWSQQADAQIPKTYALSYDSANQLVGAVLSQSGPTESLIHQYVYGYDLAGNRSSEQIDGNATNADYNDTNQLTSKRESEVSAVAVVGASVASTHTTAK